MSRVIRTIVVLLGTTLLIALPAAAQPSGTMTFGVHVTLATRWLDPADTDSEITPFMILYALHDALVKPMPGSLNAPCLAESWTMSKDGRTWEFVIRKGARFHNGDPVTAEDVKFSFERYKGAAAPLFKDRVREVQVVDATHVRFQLQEPWPDFMTFYGTSASGAAYVVPKKYVEKVGEDAYRKAPIGAGPYKFVSFQPGVELVLEAFDGYWRKTPSVRRLVLRSIPDESTRAAALKRGEVDVAYYFNGPIADDIRRTPGLTLSPTRTNGVLWVMFPEQWTPGSPWMDRRVRMAASLAIARPSSRPGARRSSGASSSEPPARPATPRPASSRSPPPGASPPTGRSPTWTASSSASSRRWTARSARRCCTRSSACSTSAWCSRRSGRTVSSAPRGRAWRNPGSR